MNDCPDNGYSKYKLFASPEELSIFVDSKNYFDNETKIDIHCAGSSVLYRLLPDQNRHRIGADKQHSVLQHGRHNTQDARNHYYHTGLRHRT